MHEISGLEEARMDFEKRTEGLSPTEKRSFNQGYVWASADAINAISDLLEDALPADEKLEVLRAFIEESTIPILMIEAATGSKYLD